MDTNVYLRSESGGGWGGVRRSGEGGGEGEERVEEEVGVGSENVYLRSRSYASSLVYVAWRMVYGA
jgi:hypothetical protein